jgi:class 3 adenylate cyclase
MSSINANGFSIRLFSLLAICFMLLTFTSAVLILVVSHDSVSMNTRDVLRQKSEAVIHAIVERIAAHRQSSQALAAHLAKILDEQSDISLVSSDLTTLLRTSLSGTPHVSTIGLVASNFRMRRVFRNPRPDLKSLVDWSDDPEFVRMVREGISNGYPSWGGLFHSEFSHTTFVNYLHPLQETPYSLLLSISINDLSDYLRQMEKEIVGNLFILFGKGQVLAHPSLVGGYAGLNDTQPLPSLNEFSDRILGAIWSGKRLPDAERWFAQALSARVVEVEGSPYVFLFRTLPGYGSETLRVGTYFALNEVAPQIHRNRQLIYVGAGLIILTLLLALVLSRMVSRPIKNITKAAEHIAHLQLDERVQLPGSHIAEVNQLTHALRSVIFGLRSFKHYVPQRLVHHVMEETEAGEIKAKEQIITVLFTDIVGFTSLAETMRVDAVVAILNEHFELINGCVESETGTIDKYIGDSVMAFWGGLDADDEHAIHACAAALRIETAIKNNNIRRLAAGEPPLKIRIGIHTGTAMVGNIGSSGRISYTIIGDTVNIASRLMEFSRQIDRPPSEALTLISGETAYRIGNDFRLHDFGEITLRGRRDMTKVYRLDHRDQSTNLPNLYHQLALQLSESIATETSTLRH